MNRPSTAKEALIAEALGEVATLIDRVEAVAPALHSSRQALVQVSETLVHQVSAFDNRMAALTQKAVEVASTHIVRRANEVTAQTLDAQVLAMKSAARDMFNKEFDPAVLRVVAHLNHLAQLAQREESLWMRWFTHVCAFVTGAALACLVLVEIWTR
jgi:hypothetical protein